MPGYIRTIPYNGYRNLLGNIGEEGISKFCTDYIEYIIVNEGDIGAILLESIRATDTHIPPKSYFKKLRSICNIYGILLIFDEIPTAIGRNGEFYVHQNFDVEPDILVLGKGLGGGVIPQAAVLTKTKYDCAGDISLGHYTHEKPALGCAAICATIDFIDENHLLDNCKKLSKYVSEKADSLYNTYECIGEVRIRGLLITFEFIKNRDSKEKHEELAEKILYKSLELGLSFKVSAGNCITWHPPLIVTENEIDIAFSIFEKAIVFSLKI